MKVFYRICFLISFTILLSCKTNNYKLQIVIEGKGISVKTVVLLDGYVIGKVDDIKVYNHKILATVLIDKKTKIPKYSHFFIQDMDALGKQAIYVEPGKNNTDYYSNNDTVNAEARESIISKITGDTQIIKQLSILIDTIKTVIKRDSIERNNN